MLSMGLPFYFMMRALSQPQSLKRSDTCRGIDKIDRFSHAFRPSRLVTPG